MSHDAANADLNFTKPTRVRRADRLLATLAMILVTACAASQLACDSGAAESGTEPTSEASAAATEGQSAEGEEAAADDALEAERLVVLGGPIAEIAFALGAGEQVVAADKSAEYPPEAASVASLDYYRMTSVEAVLSNRPDRVLASEGVGPAEVVDQLKGAGVDVVVFEEPTDVASARERILKVGEALGRTEEAEALVAELDAELEKAEAAASQVDEDLRAIFVYARGQGTLLIGGRGTSAATAIELAGANLVTEYDDFRPMSAEGLIAAAPDVVVMTEKGLKSLGGPEKVWELPGMSETPAAATRQVVAIDDLKLLGYGPRLGEAVSELSASFSNLERAEK
ncbi:ABC transporter substrate-binding protein [Lujinxingia vulgaris]|uniref:ABC transporter substrate-binding protein n=1 Tax=Lujinxingia vulgaris TaxID=2600176 RepID=A0A5C6X4Y5_9DELT|nr:ABC transporter substrate-binding protein [Lujinxingia vulgaris]TXD36198.1 ABC transporter substrate-binding protein [Lujinxingia vulgaris]